MRLDGFAAECFVFAGLLVCGCDYDGRQNGQTVTLSGITGRVIDDAGVVTGAAVRVQTTDVNAECSADGSFTLSAAELQTLPAGPTYLLTAWAPGYYIAGPLEVQPGGEVTIRLEKHPTQDHSDYPWVAARREAGEVGNCRQCHSDPDASEALLPFDEWAVDAHSQGANNARFLAMYLGTDVNGNSSPPTQFGYNRDYGEFPLPPNPALPYYGPGYKLDFPNTAGNCATCHLPAAAVAAPYATDPATVSGAGAEGVTCDLCHKIWDVILDPATGHPYDEMPGVLSMEFRRPGAGEQLFLGPFDDVAPGEDAYSSIYEESRYCAPCHFGKFWNVVIYNSFGEWLASPYSDPETGQTCQDCHMPTRGARRFARADEGGLLREPTRIASHRMPGANDESLLQHTAELVVDVQRSDDALRIEAAVTNAHAGHHIPTDSPLRNILLVVSATDETGAALELLDGPTLPEWAGDYAGQPGRGYAKVLEELWTEVSPSGAYWNPTRILSDNRIAALETDTTTYRFVAPREGRVEIVAQLIFRRVFSELKKQKQWDIPDIIMEETRIAVLP